MRNFYFLFFIFFSNSFSFASLNIDSLKICVNQQKDSIQGNTFHLIAMHYLHDVRQIDSALKYETLALKIAKKIHSVSRIINSKLNIGDAYVQIQKYYLAKKEFEEAIEIAKSEKYLKGVIDANNALGYFYANKNEYDKSIFYFISTAKEYEQLHDYNRLAYTYINIARIFWVQEQEAKSLMFIDKSLSLIPKLNSKKDVRTIIHIYSQAGDRYLPIAKKRKDSLLMMKALRLADSCLSISKKNNVNIGLAGVYFIKCSYFNSIKNHQKCIVFAKKGLEYRQSMPDENILDFQIIMSYAFIALGDLKNAKLYLDSCELKSNTKAMENQFDIAELQYSLYKKMGDKSKALAALEKLLEQKEKILNLEKNKILNELESKYQNEIKEAKITKLNQQAEFDALNIRFLFAFVGLTILMIVIIVFFYRQSIFKNKFKILETELRLNRARMDPHFFFNALSSLQSLVLKGKKQEEIAEDIHRFANIMRESLESSYNELNTLEKEINFLTNYLDLQKLRSAGKFEYHFQIDEKIELPEVLIPAMILQPFIENAIEHGFSEIAEGGIINIVFNILGENLEIMIVDNGVGFREKESHKGYPSRATQIVRDRLLLLNNQTKTNAKFTISKPAIGVGIQTIIVLPLIYRS
jgi:tetratricopeptide (TPR) repeat protein